MKKKILSVFMAVCMLLALVPTAAFAEEPGGAESPAACTCTDTCTEGSVNGDCPVCAAEGADLSACTGAALSAEAQAFTDAVSAAVAQEADILVAAQSYVDAYAAALAAGDDADANGALTAAEEAFYALFDSGALLDSYDALSEADQTATADSKAALDALADEVDALLGADTDEGEPVPYATSYDLWVGGTQITSTNAANITGITGVSGTMSYNAATATLTLNGVSINGTAAAYGSNSLYGRIYAANALTIKLVGTNTIDLSSAAAVSHSYGIYSKSGVTFTGNGSLTVTAGSATTSSAGVSTNGVLTVDGCALTLRNAQSSGDWNCGVYDWNDDGVTVKNGATLICDVSAATTTHSRGYATNSQRATLTIDATSTAIFSGSAQAAVLYTDYTSMPQTMKVTTSAAADGSNPTITQITGYKTFDKSDIKYLKLEPVPTPSVTLTDPGDSITGFQTSTDGTTYTNYTGAVKVTEGSDLYIKAILADGYTFKSWDTAGTLTANPLKLTNISENLSYTPVAEAELYDLWVGGTQITSANAKNITGITGVSGTMSYDAATNTLTLNGVSINGTAAAYSPDDNHYGRIYAKNALTVKLLGTNSIGLSNAASLYRSYGIYSSGGGVTFTGTGSLTVTAGPATGTSASVGTHGLLTVDGCTLKLVNAQASGQWNCGVWDWNSVGATVRNGATLICDASAAAGTYPGGYTTNNGSGTLTIDATSTAIFSGGYQATTLGTSTAMPLMKVTTSAAVDGSSPTITQMSGYKGFNSTNIKYLKLEPVPTYTVTLTDPGDSITGFQTSTDGTTYTNYTGAVTVTEGSNLYIKAILADGYTFKSWDTAGALTANPLKLTNISENLSYTPVAKAELYDLWVGGTQITSVNAKNITGITGVTGTMSYDAATNTLTLNGVTINGTAAAYSPDYNHYGRIYAENALTVKLLGTNAIDLSSATSVYRSYGIYSSGGGVTFTGTGSLTVTAGPATNISAAVATHGLLTVDGCTLKLVNAQASGKFNCGVWDWNYVGATVRNGATLICDASAAAGTYPQGYTTNSGSGTLTIDATSTAIFSGGYQAAKLLTTSTSMSQTMKVTTSAAVDGSNPTVAQISGYKGFNSTDIKYLKLEPVPTYTVTLTDPGDSITGFQTSTDGTTYTDYTGAVTVTEGSDLYIKAILADGYVFANWNSDTDLTANPMQLTNISQNLSYTPKTLQTVTITATTDANKLTRTYAGADFDVTDLFSIGANAGTATYSVTPGTGAGTITPAGVLTVTKAGTFDVTVTTTATSTHASASKTATLTVLKADGAGTVSMAGYTYGATVSTPACTGNTGDVTYYYSTGNSNVGGTQWSGITATTLTAGDYWMYAEVAATNLYKAFTTPAVKFTVGQATPAAVTAPTLSNVTYAPDSTLSDITLPAGWTWADGSTVPTVGNEGYTAYFAVDDVNYDYSNVSGYDADNHRVAVTVPLIVDQAAPAAVTAPTLSDVTYAPDNTLGNITLPAGWTWADGSTVPTVDNEGYTAYFAVDDVNYDYSNVSGYDADNHRVAVTVPVTVLAATPSNLDLSNAVTVPEKNGIPEATLDTAEYSGSITWNGNPEKFLGGTSYTATVTLTPKDNYTLNGLTADSFSCSGATAVTYDPDTGVVTLVYPATAPREFAALTVSGTPDKTTYNVGEAFDTAGLTVTAIYDDGTEETITTGYTVSPAAMAADTAEVTIAYNGKSADPVSVTVRENLTSIIAPNAVTGVANGAAKTAAALGLPAEVSILTSTGTTTAASVTWNVDAVVYDPASQAAQSFTVTGTVTLPDGMSNVDGVALTATVSVSVKAAALISLPGQNTAPGSPDTAERIAGITENQTVGAGLTLTITADEFIRGDKLYIPVSWATNPSGSFTHTGGITYAASVDTTGMTLGAHDFTVTYREVTLDGRAATGNTVQTVIHYTLASPSNGSQTGNTSTSGSSPKTADSAPVLVWTGLLLLGCGALTVMVYRKKRSK